MSASRYIPHARALTAAVISVLTVRGLPPLISSVKIAETEHGDVWAFVVLDVKQIARMEAYTTQDVLHQIGTVLKGRMPVICNHTGLGYGFSMGKRRSLPAKIEFPGVQDGVLQIGRSLHGDVHPDWDELGHVLVAGMTGSGKSVLLRSIAHQGIAQGGGVVVADLDGATLPMLDGHPSLLRPIARTPQDVAALVQWLLGECDHRAALYSAVDGFPENLNEYNAQVVKKAQPPLPPILVILDEYSATITALGGANGEFAGQVAQLAWRGRKFGIRAVLAAQDFSKQVIGRVRDQIGTTICFRIRSQETARTLGLTAATRIPANRPGLAVTDRWGMVQTYLLPKQVLLAQDTVALDPRERALLERAQRETGGRLSIPILVGWGIRERAARRALEHWEQRGWVLRDPERDNARYITHKLTEIMSNRQTGQTPSNRAE
jgi:energy-coupling factor transporter ATP-binding protein EcfA2